MNSTSYHVPVLCDEIVSFLVQRPEGIYLDGTLGGGGHFRAIAECLSNEGVLIGIDRDPDAVAWNISRQPSGPRVILEQVPFSGFDIVLKRENIGLLDGILLDLGVSSHQIDAPERGFSYQQEGPLDMRMNPSIGIPAHELLASASDDELAEILRDYGEVTAARRLVRSLRKQMAVTPVLTSADLRRCLDDIFGGRLSINLLARIFQALRIAVNDELGELRRFLGKVTDTLKPGGRLAIISYHSLEDRMVKEFIRENERSCSCPQALPVCVCTTRAKFKRITKKALRPSSHEQSVNRRSRSARLRVVERCGA